MATPTPNAPLSGLKLTFNENFDTLSLNTGTAATAGGTWKTVDAWGNRTQLGPHQKQFYIDADYKGLGINPFSVNNGILDIKSWKVPENLKWATGGLPYFSGWLTTPESLAQKYGYFEMRAQMPAAGKGMWPAFWMLNAPPKLFWPPEIDVMEAIGLNPTKYWTSIHTKDPAGNSGRGNDVGVNIETSFHTYGVDWKADKITFYFDGKPVYSRATPIDMHDPMYMLVNLGIGGDWPGDPDGTTDWSKAHYYVDYVRAWSYDPNAKVHWNAGSGDGGGAPVTNPNVFVGTSGNDTLVGTDGDDFMDGLDGNDVLEGGAGNDSLSGGWGSDIVKGGDGDDTMRGGGGGDALVGGNGADTYLFGYNSGNLTVDNQHTDTAVDRVIINPGIPSSALTFTQNGNDLVVTLTGTTADKLTIKNHFLGSQYALTKMILDDGSDISSRLPAAPQDPAPTPGPDPVPAATAGDDALDGTSGADVIDALAGNDVVQGFEGNDTLTGGLGDDTLAGGTGADTLYGNDGADYLDGGADADRMVGGAGDDIYIVDNAADVIVENANEGIDSVGTTLSSYTLGANLENLLYVGTGNFTGTGNELANTLGGGNGTDILSGLGGDDTLAGGGGNDTLIGGAGADSYMFATGSGMDMIDNQHTDAAADKIVLKDIAAADVSFAQVGNDLVLSLAGNTADKLTVKSWFLGSQYQGASFQLADGTAVPVTLPTPEPTPTEPTPTEPPASGPATPIPTATINGTAGNDTLVGTMSADVINGGDGNDTLSGSGGNDTLIGGAGADTYRFGVTSGKDTYFNYHTDTAADRILLNSGVTASMLKFVQSGNDLVMSINGTGDQVTVKDWFLGSEYQIGSVQLHSGTKVAINVSGTVTPPPTTYPPPTTNPPPATATLSAVLSNATNALDLSDSFAAPSTGASTSKTYTGSQMSIAGVSSTTSVNVAYDANGGLTVTNRSDWNAIKNATVKTTASGAVTINNFVDAEIALGNGANTVKVDKAKRGNIVTGTGDDTITVNAYNGSAYTSSASDSTMTINAGDGANKVSFSGASSNRATLSTGSGIDEVTVSGAAGATVWSGAGDDRIVDRSTGNVTITGGSGKDVFEFIKGAHASITDFNAGDDRIVLNGVSASSVQVTANTAGTLIDLGGGSTINLVGAALPKDQINITYA